MEKFGFIVLLPNEILLNKDTDKCTCTLIIKEKVFWRNTHAEQISADIVIYNQIF